MCVVPPPFHSSLLHQSENAKLTIPITHAQVDSLHAHLHTALQTTNAASASLDARFALLSLSLASRSQSQSLPPPTHPSAPFPAHRHQHDPHDLLRALSRIDVERPPAQIGDAARRAVREVQRVGEGERERRLTVTGGVATPRKGGTTPRRGTTPRKERER